MVGGLFFLAVMVWGITLLGSGGIVGWQAKQSGWDNADRARLLLALELALLAVVFALIPLLLLALLEKTASWRLASLLLAVVLAVEIFRIARQVRGLGLLEAHPAVLLLVFSAIMLTIEMGNMLRWGSLAGYGGGLLWLAVLAGIQFIAFVSHDRIDPSPSYTIATAARVAPERPLPVRYTHHGVLAERLQRHHRAYHPHRAAYRHADAHRDSVRHTHRLAFTRTRDGDGRTVANPFGRANQDPGTG